MDKILKGKNGTVIQILRSKLGNEIKNPPQINPKKRHATNTFQSGRLKTSDWKKITIGLNMLRKIICNGFSRQEQELLIGSTDVSRAKKEIIGYRNIIEDCFRRLDNGSRREYELKRSIESLKDLSQITQAARDGILVKQEKKIIEVDGEEKEFIYDTSMSPQEVMSILRNYERTLNRLEFNKLDNYLGLGLGISGAIGAIVKSQKQKDSQTKDSSTIIITIGTAVVGGLKLLQGMLQKDDIKKFWDIKDEEDRKIDDLLRNEQISSKAEENSIEGIRKITDQERHISTKIDNSQFLYEVVLDLAVAIISGAYINNKIKVKENGRIDGKSLASALISLQSNKALVGSIISTFDHMQKDKKTQEEFQKLCQKVQDILEQMEQKVYPLEGATHSFDSLSITNFTGNFYPKKDYENGNINYAMTIQIPEFSMQRGDVVLLSGESGTGKSTFLRFLKRGDINNRKAIQLDGTEKVDNLGDEYISFRPSINLGDETNVLYQITGKNSISELTIDECERLKRLLEELKLDTPNLLQQLEMKKFMEFSTGQQRRLALSKVFYRIDDGTSVMIVDEPVGNVEDSLIREQLEMIKRYAQNKNVMLILTTHRLDLAQDLATKRYNINKSGILEQIPIKKVDLNQEEIYH